MALSGFRARRSPRKFLHFCVVFYTSPLTKAPPRRIFVSSPRFAYRRQRAFFLGNDDSGAQQRIPARTNRFVRNSVFSDRRRFNPRVPSSSPFRSCVPFSDVFTPLRMRLIYGSQTPNCPPFEVRPAASEQPRSLPVHFVCRGTSRVRTPTKRGPHGVLSPSDERLRYSTAAHSLTNSSAMRVSSSSVFFSPARIVSSILRIFFSGR